MMISRSVTAFVTACPLRTNFHNASANTGLTATASLHRAPTQHTSVEAFHKILEKLASRARNDTALVVGAMNTHTPVARTVAACFAALLIAAGARDLPKIMHPAPVLAEVPQSAPVRAITDDANVITRAVEDNFERIAEKIKSRTGFQIRFVMVRNLPFGETTYDYAGDLAKQWELNDKDVLFVASVKTDRAGAFVGDSVKSVLSDDTARSIAEKTFALPAGDERYSAAVLDVANRLIPILNGEADPGEPDDSTKEVVQTYKTKEETKNNRDKYVKVVGGILVIAFVAPMIQTFWYVRDD